MVFHRLVHPCAVEMLPQLTAVTSNPFLVVGVRPRTGLAAVTSGHLMFLHFTTPYLKILEDFVGGGVMSHQILIANSLGIV